MAKFYGFNNLYSICARDNNNERIGYVVVFNTRAARDQWVRGEVLHNNYCHEPITATEARREMIRAAYDRMLNKGIVSSRSDLKHVPIGVILTAYSNGVL